MSGINLEWPLETRLITPALNENVRYKNAREIIGNVGQFEAVFTIEVFDNNSLLVGFMFGNLELG